MRFLPSLPSVIKGIRIAAGIGIGAFLGAVAGNLSIGEDGALWGALIGAVAGGFLYRLVVLPRWMQFLTIDPARIQARLAQVEEEIDLQSDHPHHFSLTIEVARPIEDVFAYVADPNHLPQWQTETQQVTILRQSEDGRGLRFRRQDNAVGSDGISIIEISESDPPHRLAFDYVDSFLPLETQTYTFVQQTGSTTITTGFTFADQRTAQQIKFAYIPKLRADLVTLKERLEQAHEINE